MVSKGNHPQMAARFRLVKYFHLPRYIYTYIWNLKSNHFVVEDRPSEYPFLLCPFLRLVDLAKTCTATPQKDRTGISY